ncbi:MAG: response regulator [Flavisolibacter sp.]
MTSDITSNKIILWADDDPDDLMIMKEVLNEMHYTYDIIEVQNGKQALDYLKSNKRNLPCLMILDMNMPILSGRDTLSIIKKDPTYEPMPIVIFTTSNSEMDKTFCKKYNVDMITKPPAYNSLQQIIIRLLSYCK